MTAFETAEQSAIERSKRLIAAHERNPAQVATALESADSASTALGAFLGAQPYVRRHSSASHSSRSHSASTIVSSLATV